MAKIDLILIFLLCTFRNASQNKDPLYNGYFFFMLEPAKQGHKKTLPAVLYPMLEEHKFLPRRSISTQCTRTLLLGPVTPSLIIGNKYEVPTAQVKIPQVATNEVSVRAGRSSKKSVL